MLRADFHIHTLYSMDCDMALEEIIDRCEKTGINCVAISDHGTVEGALELQKIAPFKVIVAEEVLTQNGEIMGMFLKETIPSGVTVTVDEAIAQIREQDGLVGLPHPFDPFRGLSLDGERIEELAKQLDVVEVFNARSPMNSTADKALAYAVRHDIPGTAGSDAHSPGEIGRTYVEMPDFDSKEEFLDALRQGRISQHKASIFVHLRSAWARLKRNLRAP